MFMLFQPTLLLRVLIQFMTPCLSEKLTETTWLQAIYLHLERYQIIKN